MGEKDHKRRGENLLHGLARTSLETIGSALETIELLAVGENDTAKRLQAFKELSLSHMATLDAAFHGIDLNSGILSDGRGEIYTKITTLKESVKKAAEAAEKLATDEAEARKILAEIERPPSLPKPVETLKRIMKDATRGRRPKSVESDESGAPRKAAALPAGDTPDSNPTDTEPDTGNNERLERLKEHFKPGTKHFLSPNPKKPADQWKEVEIVGGMIDDNGQIHIGIKFTADGGTYSVDPNHLSENPPQDAEPVSEFEGSPYNKTALERLGLTVDREVYVPAPPKAKDQRPRAAKVVRAEGKKVWVWDGKIENGVHIESWFYFDKMKLEKPDNALEFKVRDFKEKEPAPFEPGQRIFLKRSKRGGISYEEVFFAHVIGTDKTKARVGYGDKESGKRWIVNLGELVSELPSGVIPTSQDPNSEYHPDNRDALTIGDRRIRKGEKIFVEKLPDGKASREVEFMSPDSTEPESVWVQYKTGKKPERVELSAVRTEPPEGDIISELEGSSYPKPDTKPAPREITREELDTIQLADLQIGDVVEYEGVARAITEIKKIGEKVRGVRLEGITNRIESVKNIKKMVIPDSTRRAAAERSAETSPYALNPKVGDTFSIIFPPSRRGRDSVTKNIKITSPDADKIHFEHENGMVQSMTITEWNDFYTAGSITLLNHGEVVTPEPGGREQYKPGETREYTGFYKNPKPDDIFLITNKATRDDGTIDATTTISKIGIKILSHPDFKDMISFEYLTGKNKGEVGAWTRDTWNNRDEAATVEKSDATEVAAIETRGLALKEKFEGDPEKGKFYVFDDQYLYRVDAIDPAGEGSIQLSLPFNQTKSPLRNREWWNREVSLSGFRKATYPEDFSRTEKGEKFKFGNKKFQIDQILRDLNTGDAIIINEFIAGGPAGEPPVMFVEPLIPEEGDDSPEYSLDASDIKDFEIIEPAEAERLLDEADRILDARIKTFENPGDVFTMDGREFTIGQRVKAERADGTMVEGNIVKYINDPAEVHPLWIELADGNMEPIAQDKLSTVEALPETAPPVEKFEHEPIPGKSYVFGDQIIRVESIDLDGEGTIIVSEPRYKKTFAPMTREAWKNNVTHYPNLQEATQSDCLLKTDGDIFIFGGATLEIGKVYYDGTKGQNVKITQCIFGPDVADRIIRVETIQVEPGLEHQFDYRGIYPNQFEEARSTESERLAREAADARAKEKFEYEPKLGKFYILTHPDGKQYRFQITSLTDNNVEITLHRYEEKHLQSLKQWNEWVTATGSNFREATSEADLTVNGKDRDFKFQGRDFVIGRKMKDSEEAVGAVWIHSFIMGPGEKKIHLERADGSEYDITDTKRLKDDSDLSQKELDELLAQVRRDEEDAARVEAEARAQVERERRQAEAERVAALAEIERLRLEEEARRAAEAAAGGGGGGDEPPPEDPPEPPPEPSEQNFEFILEILDRDKIAQLHEYFARASFEQFDNRERKTGEALMRDVEEQMKNLFDDLNDEQKIQLTEVLERHGFENLEAFQEKWRQDGWIMMHNVIDQMVARDLQGAIEGDAQLQELMAQQDAAQKEKDTKTKDGKKKNWLRRAWEGSRLGVLAGVATTAVVANLNAWAHTSISARTTAATIGFFSTIAQRLGQRSQFDKKVDQRDELRVDLYARIKDSFLERQKNFGEARMAAVIQAVIEEGPDWQKSVEKNVHIKAIDFQRNAQQKKYLDNLKVVQAMPDGEAKNTALAECGKIEERLTELRLDQALFIHDQNNPATAYTDKVRVATNKSSFFSNAWDTAIRGEAGRSGEKWGLHGTKGDFWKGTMASALLNAGVGFTMASFLPRTGFNFGTEFVGDAVARAGVRFGIIGAVKGGEAGFFKRHQVETEQRKRLTQARKLLQKGDTESRRQAERLIYEANSIATDGDRAKAVLKTGLIAGGLAAGLGAGIDSARAAVFPGDFYHTNQPHNTTHAETETPPHAVDTTDGGRSLPPDPEDTQKWLDAQNAKNQQELNDYADAQKAIIAAEHARVQAELDHNNEIHKGLLDKYGKEQDLAMRTYEIQEGDGLLNAANHFEDHPVLGDKIIDSIKSSHPTWANDVLHRGERMGLSGDKLTNYANKELLHRWRVEEVERFGVRIPKGGGDWLYTKTLQPGATIKIVFDDKGPHLQVVDKNFVSTHPPRAYGQKKVFTPPLVEGLEAPADKDINVKSFYENIYEHDGPGEQIHVAPDVTASMESVGGIPVDAVATENLSANPDLHTYLSRVKTDEGYKSFVYVKDVEGNFYRTPYDKFFDSIPPTSKSAGAVADTSVNPQINRVQEIRASAENAFIDANKTSSQLNKVYDVKQSPGNRMATLNDLVSKNSIDNGAIKFQKGAGGNNVYATIGERRVLVTKDNINAISRLHEITSDPGKMTNADLRKSLDEIFKPKNAPPVEPVEPGLKVKIPAGLSPWIGDVARGDIATNADIQNQANTLSNNFGKAVQSGDQLEQAQILQQMKDLRTKVQTYDRM